MFPYEMDLPRMRRVEHLQHKNKREKKGVM